MVCIELSEEMFRDGYLNITNMDISEVVLEKMNQVYAKPGHKSAQFECGLLLLTHLDLTMDATRMNFRDSSFDICFDKGTYDALAVSIAYLCLSVGLNRKSFSEP
jgi:hypothetical protein